MQDPRAAPWHHFNPRPPRGGRRAWKCAAAVMRVFQSTSSARRTTITKQAKKQTPVFQSTSSARRTTNGQRAARQLMKDFNPRPPRGGRHAPFFLPQLAARFQSTSSARRTTLMQRVAQRMEKFQSTSSARRTTRRRFYNKAIETNFNPRPPRGGRPAKASEAYKPIIISIHVLREEEDGRKAPTDAGSHISIHVLREEDDDGH